MHEKGIGGMSLDHDGHCVNGPEGQTKYRHLYLLILVAFILFDSLQHSAGPLAVGGEAESRGSWRGYVARLARLARWLAAAGSPALAGCGYDYGWLPGFCV